LEIVDLSKSIEDSTLDDFALGLCINNKGHLVIGGGGKVKMFIICAIT
jgi:hypothetical protein